jgi:hypothetical protein
LLSSSALSNAIKASAKEPFVSPKPFALAFGPVCPVVLSVVDEALDVFALTRSAHDLWGGLRAGDTAFGVSSEGAFTTWFASIFVVEPSSASVNATVSAELTSFDLSTTVDAAELRGVCLGRAGTMGIAGTTGLMVLFCAKVLFGTPMLLENGRTEDGVVG